MLKNIELLRKENNLTQTALRMKTGIDQSLISKYESGERLPTTDNLIILADYYGTSVDFLLDRTDQRDPYPPKAPCESEQAR